MTNEEAIAELNKALDEISLSPYTYDGLARSIALEMGIKALEQEPKAEKVIKMRDATPEERESIAKYIKSISKPTGVDFRNLDQVPKIEWIPVGERLPENQDDVLVWIEYIKDDYDCAYWGFAHYSLWFKKWVVSTNERNPIVKAWMPLPEPYEAEKE